MKFKQYLNEKELSIDEMVSLIKKDCQPFLKDKNKHFKDDILYTGRQNDIDFKKKIVRKNRNPLDTPSDIHKFIDDWFYKKFHIKARSNAIFCTFDDYVAESYGTLYEIFPIGKYTAIYSEDIDDLNIMIGKIKSRVDFSHKIFDSKKEKKEYIKKEILNELDQAEYTTVLKYTESEVMINCKEYYIIKPDLIEGLL